MRLCTDRTLRILTHHRVLSAGLTYAHCGNNEFFRAKNLRVFDLSLFLLFPWHFKDIFEHVSDIFLILIRADFLF